MKRLLLFALLLGACGGVTPPKPPPTPPPTPPPPQMPPLAVQGNQFKPLVLGTSTTHDGWPYEGKATVDAVVAAHLNYVAGRLPFGPDDRPGYEKYMRVAGKATVYPKSHWGSLKVRSLLSKRGVKLPAVAPVYDLSKFNPAFDAALVQAVDYALSRGVYYEEDTLDGWWKKHSELSMETRAGNNIQGVDVGYCSDTQVPALNTFDDALLRHVVKLIGARPNVVWQAPGNEINFCTPIKAWVDTVIATIRDEEAKNGYAPRLIIVGTQGPEFSYPAGTAGSYHTDTPQPSRAWAVEINEFFPQAQAVYLAHLQGARAAGTVMHSWCDDNPHGGAWDDPAWLAECADTLTKIGGIPPPLPCTFPCPAGPECSVIEVCRPCSPPIPGNPMWDGDFGRAVEAVIAANPGWMQGRHLIGGNNQDPTPQQPNPPHPWGAEVRQKFYAAVVVQLASVGKCAVTREDAVEMSEDSVHDEEFHVIALGSGDVAGPANQYGFKSRSRRP